MWNGVNGAHMILAWCVVSTCFSHSTSYNCKNLSVEQLEDHV